MTDTSTVCVIIPHFNTPQWLGQCLSSLVNQSRKPERIVVVDDCSTLTLSSVIHSFPQITFLRTAENGGPYRIIDTLIPQLDCSIVMFQDADDWSHPQRLESLLNALEEQNADMVGCLVQNYIENSPYQADPDFPEDPYHSLLENPFMHPVFYASSIVRRNFFLNLGGFSSGFRFGADSEFVRRAVIGGRVINLSKKLYFRRLHSNSLTHHVDTGFGTAARKEVQKVIQQAAKTLMKSVKLDKKPDLRPILKGSPIKFDHLSGPQLTFPTLAQ